jgi:WhiB family redox-sensing transcriptional regulator
MYDLPTFTGEEPCQTGDPDRFFPEQGHKGAAAKRECLKCPLLDKCFDYALHTAVEGIWAGTSTGERQKLRRELRIVPDPVVPVGADDAPHRIDRDQIVRMANRGTSVSQIASQLQTSPQVVRRHLREAEGAA